MPPTTDTGSPREAHTARTGGFPQAWRLRDAGAVVLLVPRQLRFTGMTGNVPYYGGRMTPGQAYAASHSSPPAPAPASPPTPPRPDPLEALEALEQLRARGVIDEQEYEQLRTRIAT